MNLCVCVCVCLCFGIVYGCFCLYLSGGPVGKLFLLCTDSRPLMNISTLFNALLKSASSPHHH